MNPYDQERQRLLLQNKPVQFGKPKTGYQVDAIKFLQSLKPDERIHHLGLWYQHYVTWYNDQMKEYQRVAGL